MVVRVNFPGVDEQLSDRLPGWGTRDDLLDDLTAAVEPESPDRTLALFDVSGLGEYVDAFGRVEEGVLLARLEARLEEALDLDSNVRYYRPRSDELAALIDGPIGEAESALRTAVSSLTDRFDQFGVTLTFGAVMLPDEVDDPVSALMLADERLFLHAQARRARVRRSAPRGQQRPSPRLEGSEQTGSEPTCHAPLVARPRVATRETG